MRDDARRRLLRLKDDLAELSEMASRPSFSFALFASTCAEPIREQKTWKFIQDLFEAERVARPIPIEFAPIWLDQFPEENGCVRWWGNHKDIDHFKAWADKFSRTLYRYGDIVSDLKFHEGYFGGISALCAVATNTHELADLIAERTLLDLSGQTDETLGVPQEIADCGTPCVIKVQEIQCRPLHFAAKVLSQLLGEPLTGPRLVVDFDKRMVTLDGLTYQPDDQFVALLDSLAKANSVPMTRRLLRDSHSLLCEEERIDRLVKKLKKEFPALGEIVKSSQSDPAGFWIPEVYLA